ncbi:MAG: flavodoxin-dependent (E)-4-hydroxy-3-methylbut-2-enyl-diphosphate synthase [Candidatus Firestonebacteria bacterium]|mgnify:CR=1 FL=1
MIKRRRTKKICVGNIAIGGNAPVSVQSMAKVDTRNVQAVVEQIKVLEDAGCEIIRVAVPDMEAANAIASIKKQIKIPLVADIHFNYKLAITAAKNGADKLRINPGNIGDISKVQAVVDVAKERNIPIRIGANSGSLPKELVCIKNIPEAMVKAALKHIQILEDMNFTNIVISLKASDVLTTLKAYKLMAKKVNYPFHLGITEAGTLLSGTVKSAVGIATLLQDGIGDTIRVSLASSPLDEVKVGYEILKSLKLRKKGPELIVCPTCGRCEINIFSIAKQVEEKIQNIKKPIKIAIMGCIVNGPGEAKDADIGIAGGKKLGLIFKHGKPFKKVDEENLVTTLLSEINKMI